MIDTTRFISFEGIDFSGKTTQIQLLRNKLEQIGKKVIILREPGGSLISERIREILLDERYKNMTDLCELLLYSAARNQVVSEIICHDLAVGNFILADRYVDSTTAYQGYGRRLPLEFIRNLNRLVTQGIMPYITFLLEIDLKQQIYRKKIRNSGSDRLEKENLEFYQRIHTGYKKIALAQKRRIKIIDANRSIEKIEIEIWEYVMKKLKLKL
jgi:dTMP kinase